MKKFAKMSLVAAIALGGFASTASATDLAEAIKGVDISGKVRYRIEDNSGSQEDQDVNIDVTVKVPVNDNVNFIANLNIDNDDQGDEDVSLGGSSAFGLDEYYFQYVNGPVTVHLGQQGIPGRQTDGLIGQGIVGLYNAGAFTIGAASFYNTEATNGLVETTTYEWTGVTYPGDEDVYSEVTSVSAYDASVHSVIAMGSVGPVSLLGQYTIAEDLLDSYNLKADATFGPVTAGLEYSATELDSDVATALTVQDDERSTFKAYVGGSIDIVSAKLWYAATGDNGSGSIDNQVRRGSIETPAEWMLWQMGTAAVADMDVWAIDASVKVTDSISVRAAYADAEVGNTDEDEILGQISYKMSKNLNTYIRYSQYDNGTVENDRGRVEVQYTF